MKTVLISEYTRRVAHELDDRHSAWVMYNRVEKIEQASELGESIFLERPDHELWLTDYENIGKHIEQAHIRRHQLQGYLGQFKTFIQRRDYTQQHKVTMWQLQAHLTRVKNELAYVSALQSRLKGVRHALQSHLYETEISQFGGNDAMLYQLLKLAKESINSGSIEILRKALYDDGLGDLIGQALRGNKVKSVLNTPENRMALDARIAESLMAQDTSAE